MIVDIYTNSKEVMDFIKEKEGFNGVIENRSGFYKMLNVPIGYKEYLSEQVNDFIKKEKLNGAKCFPVDPRSRKYEV
tara:strand:- start:597 stop:827 length:231 start_codon:yes stop_codon:yes gene_type:complete